MSSPKPLVLVVEDDLDTQSFMRAVLASRYRVTVAASAEDARHALDEGEVAVVLLDLSLRGEEDGLAVVRYARATPHLARVPIVATTAHAFPEDQRAVLEAGCDDFLAKPVDIPLLLEKVKRYARV
jgi:CheY-like chemotaxis protein